jgi:hypothetical protein
MDLKDLLRAFLSTTLKWDGAKIDEVLNGTDVEAAKTLLLDADKARVSALTTPKAGSTYQDGFAKGKKDALTELEKAAKEKYGIETDEKGVDLIDAIVSKNTTSATLTDDAVKAHKVYQDLERAKKQELKQINDAHAKAIADKENEFNKKSTYSQVTDKALTLLDSWGVVLPSNPEIAANIKSLFGKALQDGYEYDIQGDNVVTKKDGKVVDDGHGSTVSFDNFAKGIASKFFEFKQNNGGSNTGGNNQQQQQQQATGGYPEGITRPKNFGEYSKLVTDPAISVENRLAIQKAYKEETGALTT